MKPTRRILTIPLLLMAGLLLAAAAPASAKWPTTSWTITEESSNGGGAPAGGRAAIADKHLRMLEEASLWFQSMSYLAPYQINDRNDLKFKGKESYLAYLRANPANPVSVHSSAGWMGLSSHQGFLKPQTPNDRVYQASSVHELFHGVQLAYPAYRAWASRPILPGPPLCDDGEFHLGVASYQHLFGTFSFQVYKGDLELVPGTAEHPREYAEVSGHINITSTQEDVDNHLLDFLSRPSGPGDVLQIPSLEVFMQGGSMFGK